MCNGGVQARLGGGRLGPRWLLKRTEHLYPTLSALCAHVKLKCVLGYMIQKSRSHVSSWAFHVRISIQMMPGFLPVMTQHAPSTHACWLLAAMLAAWRIVKTPSPGGSSSNTNVSTDVNEPVCVCASCADDRQHNQAPGDHQQPHRWVGRLCAAGFVWGGSRVLRLACAVLCCAVSCQAPLQSTAS
jgi:hypothetical protein